MQLNLTLSELSYSNRFVFFLFFFSKRNENSSADPKVHHAFMLFRSIGMDMSIKRVDWIRERKSSFGGERERESSFQS